MLAKTIQNLMIALRTSFPRVCQSSKCCRLDLSVHYKGREDYWGSDVYLREPYEKKWNIREGADSVWGQDGDRD
jgi:hypothetical protein